MLRQVSAQPVILKSPEMPLPLTGPLRDQPDTLSVEAEIVGGWGDDRNHTE